MISAFILAALALFALIGVVGFLVCMVKDTSQLRRELRDMRIRDEKLRRYNMAAFKGTKDRFLS